MSATGIAFRALSAGLLLWAVQASAFEKGRSDAAFVAQAQEAQAKVEKLSPPPSFQPGDTFLGRVTQVFDADTVLVQRSGGGEAVNVRLEAVDAPEVAHPEHNKLGQPYGDEAAEFLRKLCGGKVVTVKVKEVDKYGRLIGWIELSDGTAVQKELLREGWAWWNFFFSKDQSLNQLENEAIAARRGLWAGKVPGAGEKWPEAPWVFRRREAAGIKRLLPGDRADYEALDMREPDGDTVKISRQDVYGYVRLAGIDAPEVAHRGQPGQPYGPESGARLIKLVDDENKRIQIEVEDVDAYGRIVAWVKLPSRGGTLNEILLAEGFAWWYESYYPSRDDLREKQDDARKKRRGLWADLDKPELPAPVPPWDFRRRGQKVN